MSLIFDNSLTIVEAKNKFSKIANKIDDKYKNKFCSIYQQLV